MARAIFIVPLIPSLVYFVWLQLGYGAFGAVKTFHRFQRQCFTDLHPCIMFMDEGHAYGCAQCGENVREAVVIEFTQRQKLLRFVESNSDPRVIMVSEPLFFDESVLLTLQSAKNVAAVIVYEHSPDPSPIPYPPLQQEKLSTDEGDPNRKYNYYPTPSSSASPTNYARNSIGKGFKQRLYPFNMFRVNSTAAQMIREAAKRFPENDNTLATESGNKTSSTSPRYKIQSLGQMYACPPNAEPPTTEDSENESAESSSADIIGRVTSKQCLKDKTCLPIGGQSVWSALGWMNSSERGTGQEILAISAPMDSIAFFPTLALGARAEITSLAVLMAVAEAVGNYSRELGGDMLENMVRRPVYFAWNAQSWGYAGSSRFLKDIDNFKCKKEQDRVGCADPYMESLKFLDLQGAKFTLLNIGQLSPQLNPNASRLTKKFFLLGEEQYDSDGSVIPSVIERALEEQADNATNVKLDDGYRDVIPIDASQSFQRYKPDTKMITIASYEKNFTNKLYHSMYDNATEVKDINAIYNVTEVIAKAVVQAAFEDRNPNISINRTIIDQVLTCMQESWEKCELAKEYLSDEYGTYDSKKVTPGNYPGSFFPAPRTDMDPSGAAKVQLIRHFLAFHNRYEDSGAEECKTTKDCDRFFKDLNDRSAPQNQSDIREGFCSKGKCVAAVAHRHNAYGSRLNFTDTIQSEFDYTNDSDTPRQTNEETRREPLEPAWTESVWDPDLGLCAFVEDTALFGGLILGSGVIVFLFSAIITFFFDKAMFKAPAEADEAQVWSSGDPSV